MAKSAHPMSHEEYRLLRQEFSEILQRSSREIDEKNELIARWEEALWCGVENDPDLVDSYEKCQQFEWRTYKVYETSSDSGYMYNSNSGVSEYYISDSSVFKGYAAAWFNGHDYLLDDYEMTRCYTTEEEVPKEPQTDKRPTTIDNIRDWYRKRWVASNTFSEIREARQLVNQARYDLYNLSLRERRLLPDELETRRREDAACSAEFAERAAERAQAQAVLKERWEQGYEVTCVECHTFTEGRYVGTYMLDSGKVVEGTLQVEREGRYLRDRAVVFRYEEESFAGGSRQAYIRFESDRDAAPLRLAEEPVRRQLQSQTNEDDAKASSSSHVVTLPATLKYTLSESNEYLQIALGELGVAQSLDEEFEILIKTDQELGLEGELIRHVVQDVIDGRLEKIAAVRADTPSKSWKKGYTELRRELSRLTSLSEEMPSDTLELMEILKSLVDQRGSRS